MSQSNPGLFDRIAWQRFLRIVVVIAFVTATFVFTASEVLPPTLSTVAVGAIGSVAVVTAIIGFLIAAASTLEYAEAGSTALSTAADTAPHRADSEPTDDEIGAADGGSGDAEDR